MTKEEIIPLKILIIGDSAVGKSSLLIRYTDGKFDESLLSTIGVDFKKKDIDIDGEKVHFQIWDTAGAEKFNAITKTFYRGARGILVLFDLSKKETFNQVSKWLDSIFEFGESIPTVLVGAKSDLEREVQKDEAQAKADSYQIKYFETSAKLNENVNEPFQCIAKQAYDYSKHKILTQRVDIAKKTDTSNNENGEKKGCSC